MAIDNELLLNFCNETLRPAGDVLAGLVGVPDMVLNAWKGKGLSDIVGFDQAVIDQADPATLEQFGAVFAQIQDVTNSNSNGRTTLTTLDIFALLRVHRAIKKMIDDDPAFRPLIAKFAVNPRPNHAIQV